MPLANIIFLTFYNDFKYIILSPDLACSGKFHLQNYLTQITKRTIMGLKRYKIIR